MKEETLLDKAAGNYRIAVKLNKMFAGDELELNSIGYNLQQATELCIKHSLEVNGYRYSRTHDIEDLLDECESCGVDVKVTDKFYDFAPAITKWESKTRYIKNYHLARRQVERGLELVHDFLIDNGATEDMLMPIMKTSSDLRKAESFSVMKK